MTFSFTSSNAGGTEGGEGPERPNSMSVAGLSCRKAMVGTRRAISVLSGINGLRNKPSHLVGSPSLSPAYKGGFSATQVSIFD